MERIHSGNITYPQGLSSDDLNGFEALLRRANREQLWKMIESIQFKLLERGEV